MDIAWLASELDNEPTKTLKDAWESLELSIHGGTFYQQVSLEERMTIVARVLVSVSPLGHSRMRRDLTISLTQQISLFLLFLLSLPSSMHLR